jgi:hypothetical protein
MFNSDDYTALLTGVLALATFTLAWIAYKTDKNVERRKRVEAVRILSGLAVTTLSTAWAVLINDINRSSEETDFLKLSAVSGAKNLAEQIDMVIGLGLMADLMRKPSWRVGPGKAAEPTYVEVSRLGIFKAHLLYMEHLPHETPGRKLFETTTIKGLMRLLEVLIDRWGDAIETEVAKRILAESRNLLHEAQEEGGEEDPWAPARRHV